MRKLFRAALGAFAILAMAAGSGHAEDKTIRMGTMSWEDLTPITGITKKVLEDAGYTVKVTSFSEWGIAYAALVKGDTQVMVSQTDYVAQDYWNRYKRRLEKISPVSYGLYQGIGVPKYVTIDSLDQLNGSADKFGNKIIGIEAGSGEMSTTQKAVGDYGLKLTLVPGSETAMLATLKNAVSQKKCEVVTLWRPHAAFALYPIRYLKDPKGLYKPDQAWTVANPSLKKNFPNAYAFFKQFTIPLSDQEKMISQIVNEKKTPEAAAAAWMAAHPAKVNQWVQVARPAKG